MNTRLSYRALMVVLAVGSLLAAGGCITNGASRGSGASAAAEAADWDGLVRRNSRQVDKLFVRPNVQIGPYTSVMIDKAEVAFDRDWDPNRDTRDLSRRLSPEDMQRIRAEVGQMLNDTFAHALTAGGYHLVTTPEANTLRITPSIVDLYINAPEVIGSSRSETYVMDAGRMTLVADFRDAQTGQLVARAVDTKRGTNYGRLQIANSVTNSAEAQQAMSQWARTLVRGLDGLKEAAP
jgi:hypothetical protein